MEEERSPDADLFQRFIQPGVAGRSDQVPQYSLIRNSGHAFGDFVFWRRGSGGTARAGSDAGTKVPAQSLVSAPVKSHSEPANTAGPSADEQIKRVQALAQQSNAPESCSNTHSNTAQYGAQASPP